MSISKSYSVVIPVYNTDVSLAELAHRVGEQFRASGSSYEVIFVDDCSTNPRTWNMLKKLSEGDTNIHAVRLMRNFGQQAATICGIQLARGEHIVTMDDDLQHLPEEIPQLLARREHDVVIAQFRKKQHSIGKRILSRIKGYFDRIILEKPAGIQLSSFRLLNRVTVNAMLHLFDTPYPFLPAIIFYVTKDVVGVEVTHGVRREGKTGYNFFKMLRLISNLMINNSSFLLRVIGHVGLIISFLTFLMALYFIFRKLFYSVSIVGWTSVMVTVLFIGGLLLFSVGIIGEYLIRIIRGVDKRPNYIIRNHIRNE